MAQTNLMSSNLQLQNISNLIMWILPGSKMLADNFSTGPLNVVCLTMKLNIRKPLREIQKKGTENFNFTFGI